MFHGLTGKEPCMFNAMISKGVTRKAGLEPHAKKCHKGIWAPGGMYCVIIHHFVRYMFLFSVGKNRCTEPPGQFEGREGHIL